MLARAEAAGVRLRVDGADLRASGPRSAVQNWLPIMKAHRDAIAAILEALEERAAIYEFDAGMSRTEADTAARAAHRNKP